MNDGSRILGRRESSVLALILLVVAVVTCMDRGFLSSQNLRDIVIRSAPTAIICCGVMLVVVTGEIDISVGSLMALLAAVFGFLLSKQHLALSPWLGIPLVMLLGTLVGWVTGFLVTVGRVPSIMVTLGLLTALRGTATLVMRGGNIQGLPDGLTWLAKQGPFGIPISIWIAALVIVATAWMIRRTALGRRLYAIGSSPHSAAMAGLQEGRLKRFTFAYTGFLTALATVVDVPRMPQIEAGIGNELELLVITCVVVGGVAISGGRGTLIGVMLAVLLMTMIRPVLTYLAVGESGEKWTKAVQGVFILAAVVSDRLFGREGGRAVPR